MVAILWKCISRAGRKMRWLTSKNSKGSKVSETLRSKEGIWKTDRVCKIVIWWCRQIRRTQCGCEGPPILKAGVDAIEHMKKLSLVARSCRYWKIKAIGEKSIAVIPALLRGVQWRSESFCFPGVDTVLVVPLRVNIKKGCRPQRRKN